jgi:hypothetical protein
VQWLAITYFPGDGEEAEFHNLDFCSYLKRLFAEAYFVNDSRRC